MSNHAHGGSGASHGAGHGADHGPIYYIKIWALLLVLLIISITGPMLGHVWVTLLTAFGIAFVKAGLVAAYFMHLNVEKKYIWYLLYTMLLAMGLMFIAVAPDVMKTEGRNWVNQAAVNMIEHYQKEGPAGGGHHK